MERNIDKILKQNARNDGMTVPEGYFADFAARMETALPAQATATPTRQISLWARVRPYVYMAAMFGGVWLMMWLFSDMTRRAEVANEQMVASLVSSDNFYDYCSTEIDEYDMMEQMYNDGVDPIVFASF